MYDMIGKSEENYYFFTIYGQIKKIKSWALK